MLVDRHPTAGFLAEHKLSIQFPMYINGFITSWSLLTVL